MSVARKMCMAFMGIGEMFSADIKVVFLPVCCLFFFHFVFLRLLWRLGWANTLMSKDSDVCMVKITALNYTVKNVVLIMRWTVLLKPDSITWTLILKWSTFVDFIGRVMSRGHCFQLEYFLHFLHMKKLNPTKIK